MKTRTIVFVHGMFMTSLCWEEWLVYFQARGYTCLAPNWPGRDRPVAELVAVHPDPNLGKLGLSHVVAHYEKILTALPEKPVVIGHSMGGLVTQLLVQAGLAAAGVAIDSAPPAGVLTTRLSAYRASWPMISPFVSQDEPRLMPFADFQYGFTNNLPVEVQRAAYNRYVVPESRRVPRQSLGPAGRIDFSRPHAPLLLVAGSSDNTIPAPLNRANYARYQASPTPTDFVEFPGRVHFIIGQEGWQEVAGHIHDWLERKGV